LNLLQSRAWTYLGAEIESIPEQCMKNIPK
jgi:hypothetical protein